MCRDDNFSKDQREQRAIFFVASLLILEENLILEKEKDIERLADIIKNKPFILDVTTYKSLSNTEIDYFFNQANGFEYWVNFIKKIKKDNFSNVIPCIIFNPYCLDDVKKQIDEF